MLKLKTYKPEVFPDLIEKIWIAENHDEAVELLLPPNQYVNLIFPLNNSACQYENRIVDQPQMEGISLKTTSLTYPAKTKVVGVRFYAFGIYPFIQLQGKQIINKSVNCPLANEKTKKITEISAGDPAEGILPSIYDLLNGLFNHKSYETIIPVKEFYEYYRWNDETSSIEEFCRKNETNYTTLNRNFSRNFSQKIRKADKVSKVTL